MKEYPQEKMSQHYDYFFPSLVLRFSGTGKVDYEDLIDYTLFLKN